MKKMLILTRFVKEYEPVRLKEEGEKQGFEVDMVKYGQVDIGVANGKPVIDLGKGRKLSDYSLVVPRAASKKGSSMVMVKTVLLEEISKLGIKTVNGESFLKFPLMGKIEQGVMMAQASLPTVDFVTFGSKLGWRRYLNSETIKFPLMVKGRFGSHGRTVKLVEKRQELEKAFGVYKEGAVLIQPKLRVKQWYRCIVVKGEYLGEMRHRQKDKYGGEKGVLVKFNVVKMDRLKDICVKAASLFKCDYCGIDVGWDEEKKDWVIFEVNRTAQFKYFEKRTGVNVAMEMLLDEDLVK
jgi:glutathione synthase/RimK-type ligase-like ATP-grasp enzyme